MKNFIISVFIIVILTGILQMWLPWWSIAFAAFVIGLLIEQNSVIAFASGFISIFLLWTVYACLLSHANNDILAKKIATLIPLHGNVLLLLLLSGFLAGLVSGFASLSGHLLANMFGAKSR